MRLLLIEDNYDLVSILKKDLEKAGFSVDVAYDGIEGEYMGNEGIYEKGYPFKCCYTTTDCDPSMDVQGIYL